VDLREGKGSKDTFGGAEEPVDSLENAREAVERTMENLDPYGVIMEMRGIPLFAYDLPEPAPRHSPTPRTRPKTEFERAAGVLVFCFYRETCPALNPSIN
jgi:hypothetical protein